MRFTYTATVSIHMRVEASYACCYGEHARIPAHPAVIGSLAMLWGYSTSWLKGLPRYDDIEFRSFLRSYQHACLRMGKRAAAARFNSERAHLWHANHPGRGS